jgi:hypothetical protein
LAQSPIPAPKPGADCLLDTVIIAVEQLISQRGDVVASTVLAKAPCTTVAEYRGPHRAHADQSVRGNRTGFRARSCQR